jgi:hypothetical protein
VRELFYCQDPNAGIRVWIVGHRDRHGKLRALAIHMNSRGHELKYKPQYQKLIERLQQEALARFKFAEPVGYFVDAPRSN